MNRIVIYTPQQEFWYNSDIGPAFIMWMISLGISIVIVISACPDSRCNDTLKSRCKYIVLTACCTYTLHCGLIWAITRL